ncbi:MAG TPA: glycosyltransferase family 4 protein [Actinomycetes bacterium]|nr:glycosyltransferase family 4 protein [Actinomycetes bacterium]
MRVCLVLGPSAGGVGAHVRSLAAGLVARGHAVTVLGPRETTARFAFEGTGAAVVSLEISDAVRPGRDARAVRTLRANLRGSDVLHAHGLRAGLVGVAADRVPARGGHRIPLVVTWHNAVLASGPRAVALSVLERVVARGADVTLAASSDLAERARRLGARDVRDAPVSAPALPAPARSPDEVRTRLGLGDDPLVLAVGRLAPQKDYPTLLDAAARWREIGPVVAIAGAGPLDGQLRHRVESEHLRVLLLGSRDDVADLLAAADVVVVPSRWEARALVAQEALRAGVPLVASRVGGLPELVGDAAVLVPPADPVALAGSVERILGDPALAARLRAAGPARAATWPGPEQTVEQVAAVYSALTGAS